MQQRQTISWLDCDMWWKVDFKQQPATTSRVAGQSSSSKALSKSKLAPKKRSQLLFDGLQPVWSTTPFWIPGKSLHLRSMLSKSMRCTENCKACSRHSSIECFQFFSTTTPDCMMHNQCFKSWINWATKFCLICHIHLTSHHTTMNFKHLNNFL